jgi:CHAT domain-containing protein
MSDNAMHLDIHLEHDTVCVSISDDTSSLSPISQTTICDAELSKCADRMIEILNKSINDPSDTQTETQLQEAGTLLFDEICPPYMKQYICDSSFEYLILGIHEKLTHIPWELMYTGQNLLCRQFKTGRILKTHQKIFQPPERKPGYPLNIWIIANPRGDLREAAKEGLSIYKSCERNPMVQPTLDDDIPVEIIKSKIKSFDIVHFAGHAVYDSVYPSQSAWELKENNFYASHINQMRGGAAMPSLVFTNACQRVKQSEYKNEKGLSHSFIHAGVRHYIDTLWDILDAPARFFSQTFYEMLFQGFTVGESMDHARKYLIEKFGIHHLGWASYVLYGDPRIRYIDQTTGINRIFNKFKRIIVHPANIMKALMVLILMIFAGILFQEKYHQPDTIFPVQQMILNHIKQKQERTDQLFSELTNIGYITDTVSDNWTSKSRTMGMIFNAVNSQPTDKRFLYAIQNHIFNQKIFVLLETESFDIVLEQLIRKIKLMNYKEKKPLNLIIPEYILFFETAHSKNKTYVFLRMVEKDSGIVLKSIFNSIDIDNLSPLFMQISNVLSDIKKNHPIRGRIVSREQNCVHLNIGKIFGVEIGQQFRLLEHKSLLSIVSVGMNTCKGTIDKYNTTIKTGDKVELLEIVPLPNCFRHNLQYEQK